MSDAITALGEMTAGTILTEADLAGIFGRCQASIGRAVRRGELPRPVRILGKPRWTVGAVLRHIEARQEAAQRQAAKAAARMARLSP